MSTTAPPRSAPRRRALRERGERRGVPRRRRFALRGPALAAVAVAGCAALLSPLALSSATPSAASKPAAPQSQILPPSTGTPEVVPPRRGAPAGSRHVRLRSGGLDRSYILLPPVGRDRGEKAALLVVLHQEVSSGTEAVDLGLEVLREHGVALAYPDGYGGSWNSGACCGAAARDGVNDVAFVNDVLDDVGRHTPIDPSRRALLGYSGGGMLAYRLLCQPHPELIAAVEINGSLEAPCRRGLRLPDLLSVHGELDGTVGLWSSRFVNHLHMAPRSVTSTLDAVTGQAACAPRRRSVVNGIKVWRWKSCRGGSAIEMQIVPDAGHGWADVGGAERALAWLMPRLTRS